MKDQPRLLMNLVLLALLWNVFQPPGCIEPIIVVDDAPIPHPGFRVMIVEETEDRDNLPVEQMRALTSMIWREYCETHCVKVDGVAEYRVFEANHDLSQESELWQAAFARPRESLPWILISNGKTGTEQPYPADLEAKMALLKQYTP